MGRPKKSCQQKTGHWHSVCRETRHEMKTRFEKRQGHRVNPNTPKRSVPDAAEKSKHLPKKWASEKVLSTHESGR
jgi:hypothetical protein